MLDYLKGPDHHTLQSLVPLTKFWFWLANRNLLTYSKVTFESHDRIWLVRDYVAGGLFSYNVSYNNDYVAGGLVCLVCLVTTYVFSYFA